MQLLAGLACYLAALAVLIGGAATGFLLLAAEPEGGRPPSRAAPQASAPPKLAAPLGRRAERNPPPAKTHAPTTTLAESANPSGRMTPDDRASRHRAARAKPKSEPTIARRKPSLGGSTALGYAPASSRAADTASIFRSSDRPGD